MKRNISLDQRQLLGLKLRDKKTFNYLYSENLKSGNSSIEIIESKVGNSKIP